MKNSIEITALHDLHVGELQELQRRLDAFQFTPELLADKKIYDDEDEYEREREYKDYSIVNGVAVYKISGPLLTESSFFSRWFGYTSYADVRANAIALANDQEVKDILLFISSPGGSAFGVTDGADALRKLNGLKPVFTYTNQMIASGAYWLGSQARKIFLSPEAEAGSIGVILSHVSYQKANEEAGVKVTRIRSSELKAIGSSDFDLTDKEISHLQAQIDQIDGLFKDAVQSARSNIKASAMNGATYIGAEAVRVGLADAIMTYDDAINYIVSQRKTTDPRGGLYMNKADLKIALEAGKTLEDLGLSQEEVDKILAEVDETAPELTDEQLQAQADAGKTIEVPASTEVGVEAAVLVELNTKIADLTIEATKKDEKIAALEAQVADFEANAEELKSIVASVTANRRTALGFQSTVDLTKFSTATLLAEYKAVSEEFDKNFKVGGILKTKVTEESKPAPVKRDSREVGQLKGADITRKQS